MITLKEDTTLVGVSELRTHMEKILAQSKKHRVLIEKRNKPVAVIMAIEDYNRMEETMEALEDLALGYLARERDSGSKPSDYLGIEEVLKKGVKKK